MRIALDATYSLGEHLTGVGVYSRAILRGLSAAHPGNQFLWCYRPHRLLGGLREPAPPNVRRRPLLESLVPSASLFHGLNQRLPSARLPRAVVTFHDLFVLTAGYSTPDFRRRFAAQARYAAARADLVIAVSEFTAGQVGSLLGVERSRLRVIPHGVAGGPAADGRREPIILSVGSLQVRKNTLRLLESFERLRAPGWRLVLVGALGHGGSEILAAIKRSPKRQQIELPGWIPDGQLAALYSRASLFAFPSLDEGFGIPVLEAMAAGVPVVTSNCSSLPEVAGGAALFVNPRDTEEIAGALQRLIGDEGLRAQLAALGRQRAAGFTWDAAVERTWAVYQELASAGSR